MLLCLVPAAPARAQERLCSPRATAEEDTARVAAARRAYGFNADPAYIRTLTQTFQSDAYGPLPVTAAEARYLRARDRLDPGNGGRRYLTSLGDVSAGWAVKDAWPRPAYLLMHFTRDPRGHLAALKRVARFPRRLRADRVAHTLRSLRRLQDRIDDDDRALAKTGFTLEGSSVDDESNRVAVELVTARDDAAAYFRRHYGPVKTEVIAREPTKLECNTIGAYTIAPDGMSLTIGWGTGGGAVTERIEVTEFADRVEIGIVERVPVGARTMELVGADGVAALSQPLGARPVIDAASGRRARQRGPSPGDPPCPERVAPTELERVIKERTGYGMRADAPYVQSLLADDREFTEPERRWVKSVQRLDSDNRIHEYTIHYRKEWGGTSVVADYPAKPYLLVRLTKRVRPAHACAEEARPAHPHGQGGPCRRRVLRDGRPHQRRRAGRRRRHRRVLRVGRQRARPDGQRRGRGRHDAHGRRCVLRRALRRVRRGRGRRRPARVRVISRAAAGRWASSPGPGPRTRTSR